MRVYIPFIFVIIGILPQCSPKKVSHESPELPHDEEMAACMQAVDDEIVQEPGLIGSFFRKVKGQQSSISHYSYQELREKLKERQAAGDAYTALKYAEKMYTQCEDEAELTELLLLCADLCFSQKNYKKASSLYNEFVRLYPSVPEKTEHAWYYAVLCSENQQTTSTDRDQSITRETIVLAENFLKRTLFTTYKQQVVDVLQRSQQRLIEHELGVVDFYIYRGSIQAAEKRLASIRNEWVTKYAASEPLVLIYECRVAQAQHNQELIKQKMTELTSKFPAYVHEHLPQLLPFKDVLDASSLIVAHGDVKPSSFVNRF